MAEADQPPADQPPADQQPTSQEPSGQEPSGQEPSGQEPSDNPPADKLLLGIVAWGTAAFFAMGGWFINPSTTHYIYTYQEDGETKIGDVDLISLKPDSPESVKVRGRGLLIFGLFGSVLWLSVVCLLNYHLSTQDLPRRVPAVGVYLYALTLSLCFIVFILKMVDLIIDT